MLYLYLGNVKDFFMTKKKVLLTYMESGMGHIVSMQSIHDALHKYEDQVDIIDSYIMQEDGNKHQIQFEKFIIWETKQTNKIAGYGNFVFFLMDLFAGQKLLRFTHRVFFWKAVNATLEAFKKRMPDVIVSTHYFITYCAVEYKKRYNPNVKIVTYNPDNNVHTWWDSRDGMFFVNNEQAKEEAIKKRKFLPKNVENVGFTLRNSVLQTTESKTFYRKKYRIDDRFTIIVADGAYASGKACAVVKELVKTHMPMNIILIAGKNEKAMKRYHKVAAKLRHKHKEASLRVLGFQPNICELYKACDVFITKGGPNAVLDSVCMKTPVVINYYAHPIEKATTNLFCKKMKCGIYESSPKKIRKCMENLIKEPKKLLKIQERLDAMPKLENGAEKIAEYIIKQVQDEK